MSDDDAVFIEFRMKSGKVLRAEGDHAKQVCDWIKSCEALALVHGSEYRGKAMIEVEPGTNPNSRGGAR